MTWAIAITSPNGATGETKADSESDLALAITRLAEQMIEADGHKPGGSGDHTQPRKEPGKRA